MFRRIVILIVTALGIMLSSQPGLAQELITSTPVRVQIPTGAAPVIEVVTTPTATRTPTQTAVMLTAKDSAGEVNIRAEPDIESDRVGTIRAGDFYPVLGRYFRWIQFQFDSSPSGRGWVFDELVDISGDVNSIPDLSEAPLPTDDPAALAATETQIAVTEKPGGILTVTAESRIVSIPDQITQNNSTAPAEIVDVLPTFTYPPEIVAAAPTEITATPTPALDEPSFTMPGNLPPILPIVLLGAGGLLGLAVSSLRR